MSARTKQKAGCRGRSPRSPLSAAAGGRAPGQRPAHNKRRSNAERHPCQTTQQTRDAPGAPAQPDGRFCHVFQQATLRILPPQLSIHLAMVSQDRPHHTTQAGKMQGRRSGKKRDFFLPNRLDKPACRRYNISRRHGRLAQLVRALRSHRRGLGFESLIFHHYSLIRTRFSGFGYLFFTGYLLR